MQLFAVGLAAVLLIAADERAGDRNSKALEASPSRTLGGTVIARGVLVGVDPHNPNAPTVFLRTPKGDVSVAAVPGFKTCAGLKAEMEPGSVERLEKLKHHEIVVTKEWDRSTPMLFQAVSINE